MKEPRIISESALELGAPSVTKFIDLLLCCPKGGNPESCPFCPSRRLSFEDKVGWVMAQTREEILAILAFHQHCREETVLS